MNQPRDYQPVTADDVFDNDLRQLVRLSIAEDISDSVDWTTVCLLEPDVVGTCEIVPRQSGICAGLACVPAIIDEFDADLRYQILSRDGQPLVPGQAIVRLDGNARDLLTSERVLLNILSRLCGVATLTSTYVNAIRGTKTRLYDTRKTTPGWRRLEKYAVRMGGGHNHRTGLFDGFLIKDNHLGLGGEPTELLSASAAASKALKWRGGQINQLPAPEIVEIEVDSLDQLRDVLPVGPDIVLVDNFSLDDLSSAVAVRDELNPAVELEASGNVKIDTIAEIAATGVDRISSGALTHQATWLDLGMDWSAPSAT